MAIDLCNEYKILFIPNHPKITRESGSINWDQIDRIKIIGIDKYDI